MSEATMSVRRAVLRLVVEQPAEIRVAGMSAAEIRAEVEAFAKARRMAVVMADLPDGVTAKRLEAIPRGSLYPEIDALTVGQSHTFKLPRSQHQRIRLMAANRNRLGLVRLACNADADGNLCVTRLPVTNAEAATCPPLATPERPTTYDLQRLAKVAELRFAIARADHVKLRTAASREAVKRGWTIRCRLQDDGTMLVYRTDPGALPRTPFAPTPDAELVQSL